MKLKGKSESHLKTMGPLRIFASVQAWYLTTLITTLGRQKQVDRHEFKNSPVYRARSRSARTAKQRNLASKEGRGRGREKERKEERREGNRKKKRERNLWFWLAKA